MKSWRTTSVALTSLIAAMFEAASTLLDTNPETNPDWALIGGLAVVGWGFLSARDDKVTSEQAGAGK